jgi:hypothetical protein
VTRNGLPLVCAALLAALGGVSCRTAYPLQRSVPEELTATAVVVYPFGFRWPQPAWRSVELSQRLVGEALAQAGEAALFFGPSELRVYRPEDDNAWAASDAVARLAAHGIRPDRALVLRPWAEQRIQSGQRELVDAQGRAVGHGSTEETWYVGHVEVLHPSSGQRLVEVSGEHKVDPFAERTDEGADPTPELTQLMVGLTRLALAELEDHLHPPRPPGPPLATVALIPWEAYELGPQLEGLDLLDAELLRQQRVRFANPHLAPEEVPRLARLPAGLYVLGAPAGGELAAGELVVSLDGTPALPQALARLRFSPTPVQAKVRSPEGQLTEHLLP